MGRSSIAPIEATRGAYLISETDPMGIETQYYYDAAGRKVLEIKDLRKTTYSYDSLGRLATTKQWCDNDYIAHIQCNDALDRIVEVRTEDASGRIFSKETYAYDRLGNKTHAVVYNSNENFAVTQHPITIRKGSQSPTWMR